MILQALIEGGWNNSDEKAESFKSEELSDDSTSDKDNGMATIDASKKGKKKDKAKEEQEMVQSALSSQKVSVQATDDDGDGRYSQWAGSALSILFHVRAQSKMAVIKRGGKL